MTCYIKSFVKYSRGLSIKKLKENEGLKSKTTKIQKYVMFKVALLSTRAQYCCLPFEAESLDFYGMAPQVGFPTQEVGEPPPTPTSQSKMAAVCKYQ